jgi:hypothetical protein
VPEGVRRVPTEQGRAGRMLLAHQAAWQVVSSKQGGPVKITHLLLFPASPWVEQLSTVGLHVYCKLGGRLNDVVCRVAQSAAVVDLGHHCSCAWKRREW